MWIALPELAQSTPESSESAHLVMGSGWNPDRWGLRG